MFIGVGRLGSLAIMKHSSQLGSRAQDFGRIGLQCIFELDMSTLSEILFRGFCGLQEKCNQVDV